MISLGCLTGLSGQENPDNISGLSSSDSVIQVEYIKHDPTYAYGASRKIERPNFNSGNIIDPLQAVSGQVSGLIVVRPGGDPNDNFIARIRGVSSLGPVGSPLIVIDGAIGVSLNNVDPLDIKSLTVLKDASAAAIYGARASGGVILVETYSGNEGGAYNRINYHSYVTADQPLKPIGVLSREEFLARGGINFGSNTDWFDEITRRSFSQTHSLSLSNSNGKSGYYASVNYRDNDGIAAPSGFIRLSNRINFFHQALGGRLSLNANASMNTRQQQLVNKNAFRYGVIYNPTAPVFEEDMDNSFGGYFQRTLFDFYNPVAMLNQQDFISDNKNSLVQLRVSYDLSDQLSLSVNMASENHNTLKGSYWSKKDYYFGFNENGIARRQTHNHSNNLIELTTQYNNRFDKFDVDIRAGFAYQKRNDEGFAVQVKQFLFDYTGFHRIDFGALRTGNNTEASSYKIQDHLSSTFANAGLSFDNIYYVNLSLRGDAYSGFGADYPIGIFPAASFAIDITRMLNANEANNLKARIGYGITGQLPADPRMSLRYFVPGAIVDLDQDPLTTDDTYVTLQHPHEQNPQLKWEEKREFNLGLDYSLINGRIQGSIDIYSRRMSDLILPVPLEFGAANPFLPSQPALSYTAWANVGSMQLGGFEFWIAYSRINAGNVFWEPSLNFAAYSRPTINSLNKNGTGFTQLNVGNPGGPGCGCADIVRNIPNQSLGNIYGPRFLGLDENGNYILSPSINDWEQYQVIGNGLPKSDLGFANSFYLRNWNLNFLLRGIFGHNLYNSLRGLYEYNLPGYSKYHNSVSTNKDAKASSFPYYSSLFVENASYLRLDNISLVYKLKVKNQWLNNVDVYVAGQNLFTITGYTGVDPEVRYFDEQNSTNYFAHMAPGIERRDTYYQFMSFTLGLTASLK